VLVERKRRLKEKKIILINDFITRHVHQHDFSSGWCCQPVLSLPGISRAQNKSFYLNTVIFRPFLSEGPFCPPPLKQGRSLLNKEATYTNALAPNKGAYCTLVLCVFEAHGLQSGVIPIQVQIWMREAQN
jgi:hypothetical protein